MARGVEFAESVTGCDSLTWSKEKKVDAIAGAPKSTKHPNATRKLRRTRNRPDNIVMPSKATASVPIGMTNSGRIVPIICPFETNTDDLEAGSNKLSVIIYTVKAQSADMSIQVALRSIAGVDSDIS